MQVQQGKLQVLNGIEALECHQRACILIVFPIFCAQYWLHLKLVSFMMLKYFADEILTTGILFPVQQGQKRDLLPRRILCTVHFPLV